MAKRTLLVILVLALGIGAAGYVLKTRRMLDDLRQKLVQAESTKLKLLDKKLSAARTGNVHVQGKLEAAEAVAVSPQVEAPLARVLVKEGELVEAGQVLVELNDTGLRAAVEESVRIHQAALRALRTIEQLYPECEALYRQALEEAELGYMDATCEFHQELEDTERQIAGLRFEVESLRIEVERQDQLVRQGLSSKAELEKAQVKHRLKEVEMAQAEANLGKLKRTFRGQDGAEVYSKDREASLERMKALRAVEERRLTGEDLAEARAAVEESALRVKQARDYLNSVLIKSPVRGLVTAAADSPRLMGAAGQAAMSRQSGRALSFEELREVGKRVGPQDILCVVEGLDEVVVKLDVDEIDINRIRVGRSARITGVGFADRSLNGEVTSVSQKATYVAEGITTFEVTVKLLDELGAARLGMSAEIDILTEKEP